MPPGAGRGDGLAVLLNLLVAALAGVAIPLPLDRVGRDPAHWLLGAADLHHRRMGFFMFLGLAAWWIVG